MKTANKSIWKIIRTRKDERTMLEQAQLDDWLWRVTTPIQLLIFPIKLLVSLYKWTFEEIKEES